MIKSALKASTLLVAVALTGNAYAADVYGPYPVTLKGYTGDKDNTVSYSGQIARHVMENSLKSLATKGDGGDNAAELEAEMLKYFNGSEEDIAIIAPVGGDSFPIKQKTLHEISSSSKLADKTYDGAMPAWPGNMTGKEVVLDIIKRAAASKGGYDPVSGFDWGQVLAKYLHGAVPYHQAVDNYLDEKMTAENKPNNKPYSDGAAYTGKEHSWDEAFGYWGGPAHTAGLAPNVLYAISKGKDLAAADLNKDGVVDLKSEYVFQPAYYAAGADNGGSKTTTYTQNIMGAFLDGRKLITEANGEALTADQLAKLQGYAATIGSNWEKVLAEAAFKYAGSVYKDINTMQKAESDEDKAKAYRNYVKHWGELKGFSMALQAGKNNLGATAVKMNDLIGFGPVTLDNRYVTGIAEDGSFVMDRRKTWSDYQLHMLQLQELLAKDFNLKSRANDGLADLTALTDKLDTQLNAETD